jgi:predicted nucleic acid-binding protein
VVKVVSDTSPIFYLILIDASHLLPNLFGRIIIPATVERELAHPAATETVRRTITERPDWLEVRPSPPAAAANELTTLHPGERDAILLAESIAADLLILDEKRARRAAVQRGHQVVGLLGILVQGAKHGLVDLDDAITRLQATNFRLNPALIDLVRSRSS